MTNPLHRLESNIASWVTDRVADHITTYGGSTFGGTSLRWSNNMPDDDPYAELLLVDSDGIEYALDVEIFLRRVKDNKIDDTLLQES